MTRYNIYRRKDGRWEGRIPRGKKPNGKRKFKYIFGISKEQVRKKMEEFLNLEAQQSNDCTKTISALFTEWYNNAVHRVKESTAANYSMKANNHILPQFGDKKISEISSDDVYDFIELKQNDGLSNRYISDIVVLIKSIFKYAVRLYRIVNPMDGVVLPKRKAPDIKLLDKDEQKKLQEHISNNHNRSTMGIALTMESGLRIGELCGLQWKDIDLEKRVMTVNKTVQRIQCRDENSKTKVIITDPKSESSIRKIPLKKDMVDFLMEFKGKSNEFILSGEETPLEPRTMQYRFAKILKNVNLPSVHFHSLRHVFASTCIKLGFDVKSLSELLGHSSVEVTLNRYVHSSFDQKREYMERLNLNF